MGPVADEQVAPVSEGAASGPDSRGVLLVDGDGAHLAAMTQILRPVLRSVEARERLRDLPPDGAHGLVVVNYDALDVGERARLLEAFSGARPGRARRTRLLVLSGGACREDLPQLFGRRALTNLIARNGEVDPVDLIVTVQKILRRDIFGIEKYFAWGVEPLTLRLSGSGDKPRLLARAEEFAREAGLRARQAALFCTVADELVTNAVYNAPRRPEGEFRFAHHHRSDTVTLDPGEEVLIRLCSDGRRLGIAAIDPFGSLTEERLLDGLARCFRRGPDQIEEKSGGAGLGFYFVLDAVSHLVVNVAEGVRTEVIGLFDLGDRFRDVAGRHKSFNVFLAGG